MKSVTNSAHEKHREDFKSFVISQSDRIYRPVLRRLYALWETYAEELFEEPMTPPYIILSRPPWEARVCSGQ